MLRTCISRTCRHLGRSMRTTSRGYADGILNTSVAWANFENKLRSALGTNARLGANKSVLDIGDGKGFASCCGLIKCDWIGAAAHEKLPSEVVIKIPSTQPIRRLNDSLPLAQKIVNDEELQKLQGEIEDMHNVEVATYKYFADFEGLPVPRLYYGQPVEGEGGGGQIGLEYVANSRTLNFHERPTADKMIQVARALGKIQACSLRKEPTNSAFQIDYLRLLDETWPVEALRGIFRSLLDVDSRQSTKQLLEKIDALLPNFYTRNIASAIHKQKQFKPVLVNGDLHTGNVLIDKDSGNLLALIDWQCTHLGVGVEDLHRIAMSALTTEDRRAIMPILVEEMYKSMVENLNNVDSPYSLEQLLALSDLFFPQCALFFCSSFIPVVTKFASDSSINNSEEADRKGIMMDKIIGVLEDVVEFEENKQTNNLSL